MAAAQDAQDPSAATPVALEGVQPETCWYAIRKVAPNIRRPMMNCIRMVSFKSPIWPTHLLAQIRAR